MKEDERYDTELDSKIKLYDAHQSVIFIKVIQVVTIFSSGSSIYSNLPNQTISVEKNWVNSFQKHNYTLVSVKIFKCG